MVKHEAGTRERGRRREGGRGGEGVREMNREAAAERASLVRDIEDRTPTDGDALQHGHARLRQLAWSEKKQLKLTTEPLLIGWIQFFFFFFGTLAKSPLCSVQKTAGLSKRTLL